MAFNIKEIFKAVDDEDAFTGAEDEFYEQPLSKQVHTIENVVWRSRNSITLFENINE